MRQAATNRPKGSLDLEEAARRFAEDGALFAGEVLDADELTEVRRHLKRYMEHVVPRLPEKILAKTVRIEEGGKELRSCYFMDQIDEYFNAFGNREDFKDLIRAVAGWEPELYVVETFNKPAHVGSAASAHQDCAFLPLEPMDIAHLWIAIDPSTAENGALRYWLGSHADGLLPHVPAQWGQGVDPAYVDHDDPRLTVMEIPPGSAAIHSGLVVHDSPPNISGKPRLGLLCGYRGAHTRYLDDGADG
ncbi:phytanoyl-CoA dioxygenase family protein [Streptomyces albus]|uniref:phytanoyl-CoA dioxygenase family protein n=1 Tax=Streptomyces albus TaxID=1888 RepID=UPI00340688D6